MQKVLLTAKNSRRLAGEYYEANPPAGGPRGFVIYAHMMPATKESWRPLASFLAERGFSGIAIDLRGHGESEGGPRGYAKFSDTEHQKGISDLEDAADFLRFHGATDPQIVCIGASIGANLSLEFLGRHRECKKAVLLSAGLNYRGLDALQLAARLHGGQEVFFAASHDDIQAKIGTNAEEAEAIAQALPKGVPYRARIYDSGGHGTNLLATHPELRKEILGFLLGPARRPRPAKGEAPLQRGYG